jgi:hypothetical protein
MRTGRAENWWEFGFQKSETLKGYQNIFKKIINENLKCSLKMALIRGTGGSRKVRTTQHCPLPQW